MHERRQMRREDEAGEEGRCQAGQEPPAAVAAVLAAVLAASLASVLSAALQAAISVPDDCPTLACHHHPTLAFDCWHAHSTRDAWLLLRG